ncbi:amino-acid permease BAT1 homolog [Cynara cardunculus var. scolymus]|uniref:Amino acid/polyamine transporter I n=1 Tax=Cynara cardunculus var. scolymus TaxID=59895 RepID=A0A118JXF8_CYNCS|nr:amino-acid permease BAT1 homolog [Cynara cardunculus var. scolymus]KVH96266.1 Amino acid/polyamine transporter I [Cynara cardunculus var. scolymus]
MENKIRNYGDEAVPYHRLRDGTGVCNEIVGTGDDSRLNELGYKQELHRGLSLLANFSVTFSIISVITGITTLFSTGLTFGGPISMVYGWPIAGLFSLLVGLSMSEICSAYPTAAGLYFWSARLCGSEWGPFASWLTGWDRCG